MKRIIFITLSLIMLCGPISAQQDCPQVDCPGICGRFIDNDGDGFCDHGQLSKPKAEPADQAQQPKETAKTATPTAAPTSQPKNFNDEKENASQPVQQDCPEVNCPGKCGRFVDGDGDGFCDHGHLSKPEAQPSVQPQPETPEQEEKKSSSPYHVYLILGITLLLYLISFILVKVNVWTKVTHRKVWNVALSVTFLASCLLGLLLAIFIHHGYRPQNYLLLLKLHVWFGIAMTVIAFFHALWHINYFKTIFKKRKE
ncbi:MAG: hypothetical protein IKN98_05720 [Bacteroidales bacterium]|nr:hypothetical protein [Bacteroidales bacterium]